MSRIEDALEKAARLRESKGEGEEGAAPTPLERTIGRVAPGWNREAVKPARKEPAEKGAPPVAETELQIDHPLVVTYRDPRSPIAEEFRKLKGAIVDRIRQGEARRTLMITSSLSAEGKSMTALNLAITLAQEYDHTVLLVDADLRKPSLHKYFHINPDIGLSDCLSDGLDIGEAIIKTGIGKLSFLPAGREVENPAELLGAERMKVLVQEMRQRYPDRFVILDTPPVLPVAETRTLCAYVDGVVFVIREGAVSRTHVEDALAAVNRKKVLGVVLNNIRSESLKGRYHYYYHGY